MKRSTKPAKIKSSGERNTEPARPVKDDLFRTAKYEEKEGNLDEAAKLYEALIKSYPANEYSYNRLMMIYRRQKDYKNELRIINEGIRIFQELYTPSAIGKHKNIIKLSRQLNILTGLTDKKGKSVYDAEPIGKWKKRKQVVLKKLGKI
jgi:tetratricopeptide (TPR) repeat protein